MNWKSIEISVSPAGADKVQEALEIAGILEYAVSDPRELADFMKSSVYYDYMDDALLREEMVKVTVYVQENASGKEKEALLEEILAQLNEAGVTTQRIQAEIAEEDWMNSWKKYYKPMKIGEKILIKPSWETLPEDVGARKVLEIDPSSSFGTGTHETTRLCLAGLETIISPRDEVLDMGCGSGILGVGTLLLGAKYVTAVDIEEDAMRVTRENMLRNGFGEKDFRTIQGNVLEDTDVQKYVKDRNYDVIAANIVANVILAMQPLFFDTLKENGTLVASGIILDRLEEVKSNYQKNHFTIMETFLEGEWAAIVMRKN
ncbi:MAG: 50S ribosomal protein L11 methyltransferase [Christensenellaceae bacterium]|jgi:ribosomal protein L11 methyltransferase